MLLQNELEILKKYTYPKKKAMTIILNKKNSLQEIQPLFCVQLFLKYGHPK